MSKQSLPKATLVSSLWPKIASFMRSHRGTAAKVVLSFVVTALGVWGVIGMQACIERNRVACALRDGARVEIARFRRADVNFLYYVLNPETKVLDEHSLYPSRTTILIDVPPDGKPFIDFTTVFRDNACDLYGKVHLRNAAEIE